MTKIEVIINKLQNIQKLIEINDPNESLEWLNEVYICADESEAELKEINTKYKEMVNYINKW